MSGPVPVPPRRRLFEALSSESLSPRCMFSFAYTLAGVPGPASWPRRSLALCSLDIDKAHGWHTFAARDM